MLPVVRTGFRIVNRLCAAGVGRQVHWHPAAIRMGHTYFTSLSAEWLDGGPFPAISLTAMVFAEDRSLTTDGLACFIGRELRLAPQPRLASDRERLAKIASHLVNPLVETGPPVSKTTLPLRDGRELQLRDRPGEGLILAGWESPGAG